MTATRKYPSAALRFQAAAPTVERAPEPAAGEARQNAKVRGVANSGAVMPGFFGPVVIDLQSAQIQRRAQVPILFDHCNPIGFATSLQITPAGLEYEGEIIDAPTNEAGRRVVEFAQGGMQWQMSCMAIPTTVETVPPGTQVVVNGRTLVGPVEIFRAAEIRELTITPTGRDDQTHAQVFNAAAEGVVVPVTRFDMADEKPKGDDTSEADGGAPQTVEDLKKQFPALVELIEERARNEGYQKGVKEERDRAEGVMDEADEAAKPEGGGEAAPAAIAASLKRARFHLKQGTNLEVAKADFASLKDAGLFRATGARAPSKADERFGVDPLTEAPAKTPSAGGQGDPEEAAQRARFNADKALQNKFGSFEAFQGWETLQARRNRKGA